MELLDYVSAP